MFALGFSSLAQISRLTRTSMLDVLGQDYIKTAKAKGLSQPAIIWKHALRNSVTRWSPCWVPSPRACWTGGFVVENIFSIPGMGRYFVQSIQNLDYTMISGHHHFLRRVFDFGQPGGGTWCTASSTRE